MTENLTNIVINIVMRYFIKVALLVNLQHLAYEYGRRGACLALTARREKSLQEVADRARDLGSPNVITIRADVSKVDDCRKLVEETVNHFGRCKFKVNSYLIT